MAAIFFVIFPCLFLPSLFLSQGVAACKPLNSTLHRLLINDTNYGPLNSMCLRMGEDRQATISLFPYSLFIFFSPVISLFRLSGSPIPSLQVPFLTSSLFLSTSCLLSPRPLLPLILSPPLCLFSVSIVLFFFSHSYWEEAMLSYNLDNAGSHVYVLVPTVCACA